MKIEIWSDIACPFCYIGKRQLEEALAKYELRDKVVVEWKSFQLDPTVVSNPSQNLLASLMDKKGWSKQQAEEAMGHVITMGEKYALKYDFEKVVVANTFDAHRLLHFAKRERMQSEVKELLMQAYFMEGKNIADKPTLIEIGKSAGLSDVHLDILMYTDQYREEVLYDMQEARKFGINGVPFFVFDRKFGVSGAQGVEALLDAMQQSQVVDN
jgi:predicted DsbA family dithiol-disulfide isomerase